MTMGVGMTVFMARMTLCSSQASRLTKHQLLDRRVLFSTTSYLSLPLRRRAQHKNQQSLATTRNHLHLATLKGPHHTEAPCKLAQVEGLADNPPPTSSVRQRSHRRVRNTPQESVKVQQLCPGLGGIAADNRPAWLGRWAANLKSPRRTQNVAFAAPLTR